MQWQDDAILLHAQPHGETGVIVQLFSREHGVHAGMVRGRKSVASICQPGNLVQASWKARLVQHLGMFTLELTRPFAAHAMRDRGRIAALSSMAHWLRVSFPERDPQPQIFDHTLGLLEEISLHPHWLEAYIRFELLLLQAHGFGLDLQHCASTGETENLTYLSPKTGRAVCQSAGAPYHDKLLPLPPLLLELGQGQVSAHTPAQSYRECLRVCGYFLEKWLTTPHAITMPPTRATLLEMCCEMEVI